MKNEKLLDSIGHLADNYVEEAIPQQRVLRKRNMLRYILAATCMVIFLLAATVFATNYVQDSMSSFYLRYLSSPKMAVADSLAAEYGAKVYFDGLKSNEPYQQYFSINKLVEYFNDPQICAQAIEAITPFLANTEEKIADAAAFALSILTRTYDDPRLIHMSEGTILFTLFHDYSDYGTYPQIWRIQEDTLEEFASFDRPKMYIQQMLPSPDVRLIAVTLVSNKSSYLLIYDIENHTVSPELIDSTRILVASDLGYTFWQRSDYENYSGISELAWVDHETIEFFASLCYDGGAVEEKAAVHFHVHQKNIEYSILSEVIS